MRKCRSDISFCISVSVDRLPTLTQHLTVLPNKQQGLSELEAKIHENSLANIEMKRAEMQVAIPKFCLKADLDLKDALIGMGMPDAFDEKTADFSGISVEKDLFVSDIFHKSFIDVNEGGCEAAAATFSSSCLKLSV